MGCDDFGVLDDDMVDFDGAKALYRNLKSQALESFLVDFGQIRKFFGQPI